MATYQTYQSVGNREDLTDIITNISPMDTWFTSNSGSANAKGTYHEWQTDALAAAAANAKIEGAAASDGTITATSRAGNYTQIMEKCFKIAKTQEAIDKAGRKSEIAYQTEKHMKELARDLEYALLLNTRGLKGVRGWIATNTATAASATVSATETGVNNVLQLIWTEGGSPSNVLCGAVAKKLFSGMATSQRQYIDANKTVTNTVDVYQSDFGTVAIRLHHIINASAPTQVMILGDMSLWAKAWLRGIKRQQEPFAGDADLFSIRGEITLESKQEKGSGILTLG